MIKSLAIWTVTFAVCLIMAVLVLLAAAAVPQEKISEHYEDSALFLCQKSVFFELQEGKPASKIDRYADSILLNIAWCLEPTLQAVMWDMYYYTPVQNENNNLWDAVEKGESANQQYMRYWHGSAAPVRVLHLFWSIRQIYIACAVLMALLLVLLEVMLFRRRMIGEAVSLLIGLVAVSVWFVPFSLEYTWAFLVMLAASVLAVRLAGSGIHETLLGVLFLVTGIVTNYLDFLTAETLTLTIPLLLVCRMGAGVQRAGGPAAALTTTQSLKLDEAPARVGTCRVLRCGLLWLVGYAGMWFSKWGLASRILDEDIRQFVTGHIEERVGDGGSDEVKGALANNLRCLFPADWSTTAAVAVCVLVIGGLLVLFFVYRRKEVCRGRIALYACIALVPYLRFAVLHNQSYLHYFFTYRAQMAAVVACCFIVLEIVKGRDPVHAVSE